MYITIYYKFAFDSGLEQQLSNATAELRRLKPELSSLVQK